MMLRRLAEEMSFTRWTHSMDKVLRAKALEDFFLNLVFFTRNNNGLPMSRTKSVCLR